MSQETIRFLSCAFTLVAFSGFILYLPLKSHWSKIFSFWDAMSFYCGIGCAGLLVYFASEGWEIPYEEMSPVQTIIFAVVSSVFMIGFILWGFFTLIACWQNCSNIIEVILMPLIMLSMVGVFIIGIMIIALLLGNSRESTFWWDNSD